MEYSADQIKKMTQLGALGYGVQKCANVIEVDCTDQFETEFFNPASEIGKAYQKGKDMADFAIDAKLFDLAKNGDLEALAEFNERKASRELADEDNFTDKYA
jgi:hypothetical protein